MSGAENRHPAFAILKVGTEYLVQEVFFVGVVGFGIGHVVARAETLEKARKAVPTKRSMLTTCEIKMDLGRLKESLVEVWV